MKSEEQIQVVSLDTVFFLSLPCRDFVGESTQASMTFTCYKKLYTIYILGPTKTP